MNVNGLVSSLETGGNEHAVQHYYQTMYPIVVKLGTITVETAGASLLCVLCALAFFLTFSLTTLFALFTDVYSYAEDDMVTDPLLDKHLEHFGVDRTKMKKVDIRG